RADRAAHPVGVEEEIADLHRRSPSLGRDARLVHLPAGAMLRPARTGAESGTRAAGRFRAVTGAARHRAQAGVSCSSFSVPCSALFAGLFSPSCSPLLPAAPSSSAGPPSLGR